MAKAKITDKELFGVYLDVLWAVHDQTIHVEEMVDMLKQERKSKQRLVRRLKAVREHYKELYGKYPKRLKVNQADAIDPFE